MGKGAQKLFNFFGKTDCHFSKILPVGIGSLLARKSTLSGKAQIFVAPLFYA